MEEINTGQEKILEVFYDHYKDTFAHIKGYLDKRNAYTLICIALIGILLLDTIDPVANKSLFTELVKIKIGEITIDFDIIRSIMFFVTFWACLLYFQVNMLIEKQYSYLHKIENDITEKIKPFEITREGKSYLESYPFLSFFTHRIYVVFFPLLLMWIFFYKLKIEAGNFLELKIYSHTFFNVVIIFLSLISSFLYFLNRNYNFFNSLFPRKKKQKSVK